MNTANFEKKGFIILKNVLDEKMISSLLESFSKLKPSNAVGKKNNSIYGVRNLLNLLPEIREFSESKEINQIVEDFIGENAKPVRAIYFDKTPDANWKVPWHQDLTISVKEKRRTKGFTAWTIKAGIQHVQPPNEILENILTLRFYLDDSNESNGALKLLLGTHRKGRLTADEIKSEIQKAKTFQCEASKGDVLLMKPLILHSSSAGSNPKNRRVIHIDYSNVTLPNGIKWYGS